MTDGLLFLIVVALWGISDALNGIKRKMKDYE